MTCPICNGEGVCHRIPPHQVSWTKCYACDGSGQRSPEEINELIAKLLVETRSLRENAERARDALNGDWSQR